MNLILYGLGISLAIAFLLMILQKCFEKNFIYILIVISILVVCGLAVYFTVDLNNEPITNKTERLKKIIKASFCYAVTLIMILALINFRKFIRLAAIILKIASRFISSNYFYVFLPIGLFFIMLPFLGLWIYQAIGFYSLGLPQPNNNNVYPFQHFYLPIYLKVLLIIHAVYLAWGIIFLIDTSSFIICGTASGWFYRRDKAYSESAERYISMHIGSVALGSFMTIIMGITKLLYEILSIRDCVS